MSHSQTPLVLTLLADVADLDQVDGYAPYLQDYVDEGRARIDLSLLVELRQRNVMAAGRNAQLVQLNAHLAQRNELAAQEMARLQQLNDQHDVLILIGHRIAGELERIADCCQYGSERAEAMLDVSLTHYQLPPNERYARYIEMLSTARAPAPEAG